MDLVRAFTYPFDDRDWPAHLAVTGLVGTAMIVLMPVFLLGLVGVAALVGYQLAIIGRMRAKEARPLARWLPLEDKISQGFNVVVALLIYALPLAVLFGCAGLPALFGAGGGLLSSVLLLTATPIALAYVLLANAVFVLAMVRYSETRAFGEFFDLGVLLAQVGSHAGLSFQFVLLNLLATLVWLVVGAVPVVGTFVALALYPVTTAHLIGQFARGLDPRSVRRAARRR